MELGHIGGASTLLTTIGHSRQRSNVAWSTPVRSRDLCFGAAVAGPPAERQRPKLHCSRRTDTRTEWSAASSAPSELGSTFPIIFLTGHPDVPTTVRAIKAGAHDFLTKPVTSDDLVHAIEKAFADHQISRDVQNKLGGVRARSRH